MLTEGTREAMSTSKANFILNSKMFTPCENGDLLWMQIKSRYLRFSNDYDKERAG